MAANLFGRLGAIMDGDEGTVLRIMPALDQDRSARRGIVHGIARRDQIEAEQGGQRRRPRPLDHRLLQLREPQDRERQEILDLRAMLHASEESVARRAAATDPQTVEMMVKHLTTHHLTTQQVGELAEKAGVKAVVLTHLAGGAAPDAGATARYAAQVKSVYHGGPVTVASDMDRF